MNVNKWQRDVLELIEHLRKFQGWTLPAEVKRYDRSAVSVGTRGKMFRVFRGGATWTEPALSIDASCVRDVETKQAALLLARTLGDGWRCVMLAVGNSMAVFANGHLVGRVRASKKNPRKFPKSISWGPGPWCHNR